MQLTARRKLWLTADKKSVVVSGPGKGYLFKAPGDPVTPQEVAQYDLTEEHVAGLPPQMPTDEPQTADVSGAPATKATTKATSKKTKKAE